MRYKIYFKNVFIGMLEISDEGKHKYDPCEEGIKQVENEVVLIHEMTEKSAWREPIPFFYNRIENAKRFAKENDISSQTDYFRMVKVEKNETPLNDGE